MKTSVPPCVDYGMIHNMALFKLNNNCGYILKPKVGKSSFETGMWLVIFTLCVAM